MDQNVVRKYFIGAIFILFAFVFLVRLFYLQVINTSYKLSAENNSKRVETLYPARGLIYDRNGNLLVFNTAAYDLMIAPYQLAEFDTAELCKLLDIDKNQLERGIERAFIPKYRREPFIKQITPETYAYLQEKLYQYPGFYVRARTLRKYEQPIAAHVLGYVGEVDEEIIKNDPDYTLGDYIGISGIERSYEKYLRGQKGVRVYMVDVHNRVKGSYQNGRFDKNAVVGKNLYCTIDTDLQEYGEKLMTEFRGSIVAIEPSSGEVLALISAPSYDPSLLVGRPRTNNYRYLLLDSTKPLFNRALMAKYPPGSTFKLVNALIGLQEGNLKTSTKYYCDYGYYALGRIMMKCHDHYSPLALVGAIQNSCNAYFCNVYRRILEDQKYNSISEAFTQWRNYVLSFGFGMDLNTDFSEELRGFVPTSSYFDRYYGEGRWKALTILSMATGQGELGITPLQLCNMAAAIANKGYYYTPHIVKYVQDFNTAGRRFNEKHFTAIDSAYFPIILEGMELAVNGGEGSTARIAKLKDIIVCGKTGTAENPHGKDHSVFVAFAPKDNPQIAISVYVEHGGWGASYAAPIASFMIEKYLTGEMKRTWLENYILNRKIDYSAKEE